MEDARVCLGDGAMHNPRLGKTVRVAVSDASVQMIGSGIWLLQSSAILWHCLQSDDGYLVCCAELDLEDLSVTPRGQIATPPPQEGATILSVASHPSSYQKFSVLWSSGHLCTYSSPPLEQWTSQETLLPDRTIPVQTGSRAVLAYIQPAALLTLGVAPAGEAHKPVLAEARVWHATFGTLYAGCKVDELADVQSRVTVSPSGADGRVLFQTDKNVWFGKLNHLPELTLATALGSGTAVSEVGCGSCKLGDMLFGEVPSGGKPSKKKSKKKTVAGWTAEQVAAAMEFVGSASEKELEKCVQGYLEQGGLFPQPLVNSICERCCGPEPSNQTKPSKTPPRVQAPGVLQMLLERGLVSGRLHPRVLPRSLEAKMGDLVLACLQCIRDVPETDLVKCLEFAIVGGMEVPGTPSKKSKKKSEKVGKDQILLAAVQAECTPQALLDALQTLTVEVSSELLAWLVAQLEREAGPASKKVMTWISAMLDAHFHDLVFCQEAHDALFRCCALTGEQLEMCNELCKLESFRHLGSRSRKAQPTAQVPEYCIAYLDL
eukprot:TRINITY_DN15819_c0_g1_i4.p1 TRINITY_DN15819_c0_g1~~TRINITY_DN15819_c0_g1_i4.p1  ORF type:complete len:547 (+),score=97.45 TRINITY_DN15819_c0_g1_i4:273-1913(+)